MHYYILMQSSLSEIVYRKQKKELSFLQLQLSSLKRQIKETCEYYLYILL